MLMTVEIDSWLGCKIGSLPEGAGARSASEGAAPSPRELARGARLRELNPLLDSPVNQQTNAFKIPIDVNIEYP